MTSEITTILNSAAVQAVDIQMDGRTAFLPSRLPTENQDSGPRTTETTTLGSFMLRLL